MHGKVDPEDNKTEEQNHACDHGYGSAPLSAIKTRWLRVQIRPRWLLWCISNCGDLGLGGINEACLIEVTYVVGVRINELALGATFHENYYASKLGLADF